MVNRLKIKKVIGKQYKELLKQEYKRNIRHYHERINNLKKTNIDMELNSEVEWLKRRKTMINRMILDKNRAKNGANRVIATPKARKTKKLKLKCGYCKAKILDETLEICEMCGEKIH